jgi:NAD(P)-dependent dehydrogenase (short-subunit alcohol dehydrogenase family)
MKINSQTVLVTGAGSGLGKATALLLGEAGAKVICMDLDPAAAAKAAASTGGFAVACDVSNDAAVAKALEEAQAALGVPRAVVHCAGVSLPARMIARDGSLSIGAFETSVRVNTLGTYIVMSRAAAAMAELEPLEDGERGVIITTASIASEDGQVGQCGYAASKAAVAAMTLPAARELSRFGIRVVSISPGLFDTPLMNVLSEAARESLKQLTVFPKRLGRAEEFATTARWIIETIILNGETIRLDGAIRLPA